MIVKDLVLQLLEMPQHKEVAVRVDADGRTSTLTPITSIEENGPNNAVVISLEE